MEVQEGAGAGAHVDLAGLGCRAKGQSSSEGCACVSACAHMQQVGKEATGWADTTEEGSRKLKFTWASFPFLYKTISNVTFLKQRGELLVWSPWQEQKPPWATQRTLSRNNGQKCLETLTSCVRLVIGNHAPTCSSVTPTSPSPDYTRQLRGRNKGNM